MARTLGSFNKNVNLPEHSSDWQKQPLAEKVKDPQALIGYSLGLFRSNQERDVQVPTNAEKFASSFNNRVRNGTRMAGSALTQDAIQSTGLPEGFTLPTIGLAEMRNLTAPS